MRLTCSSSSDETFIASVFSPESIAPPKKSASSPAALKVVVAMAGVADAAPARNVLVPVATIPSTRIESSSKSGNPFVLKGVAFGWACGKQLISRQSRYQTDIHTLRYASQISSVAVTIFRPSSQPKPDWPRMALTMPNSFLSYGTSCQSDWV